MANADETGLNSLPFLERQRVAGSVTPLSSSRTNCSYTARRSTCSFASSPSVTPRLTAAAATLLSYNGNYEGDTSMFCQLTKTHCSGQNLVETTDSEEELISDLSGYEATRKAAADAAAADKPWRRLCRHYTARYIEPERLVQLNEFAWRCRNSFAYRQLCELLRLSSVLFLWLLRFVIVYVVHVAKWSSRLGRCKSVLRNTARRLLWWMTLVKFQDAAYFGCIALVTPVLFVVASIGFVISLYCAFKNCLSRYGTFIKHHVL